MVLTASFTCNRQILTRLDHFIYTQLFVCIENGLDYSVPLEIRTEIHSLNTEHVGYSRVDPQLNKVTILFAGGPKNVWTTVR